MNTLWTLELIACSYMTGLILLVHFIHYPSFALIRQLEFREFSKFHSRIITRIVLPGMSAELIVAIFLVYYSPAIKTYLNIASVAALWFITGLKSASTHQKLTIEGFTFPLFQDLMRWNYIRTLIWCARFIALGFFAIRGWT